MCKNVQEEISGKDSGNVHKTFREKSGTEQLSDVKFFSYMYKNVEWKL